MGADWFTIAPLSGRDDGVIQFTAADNPSIGDRQTEFIIALQTGKQLKIGLKQFGRTLTASATSVMFFAKGGTADPISIYTDGTYAISQEGDWSLIRPISGIKLI